MKIPKLKKQVNAFLVGEDAKISKEKIMKMGLTLGALATFGALAAKEAAAGYIHSNGIGWPAKGNAYHSHHASHSSY